MRKLLLVIMSAAVLLLCAVELPAKRTRQGVRQQKQQTERQIAETNKKIRENDASVKRRLSQLNLLSGRMAETKRDIARLNRSVDSMDRAVRHLSDSIKGMEHHLELIRGRYAAAVKRARINRGSSGDMAFVFSAGSVMQGYRRYRYMQEYSRWRERKTGEINQTMAQLDSARNSMEAMKAERRKSIAELEGRRRNLALRHDSTAVIVASLKKEGKSLKRILSQKQAEARKLDAELERLIAEEQRKAAEEEARKKREAAGKQEGQTPMAAATPDAKKQPQPQPKASEDIPRLSGSFLANKGKLPMPVSGSYTVVSDFGRHKHPELKYVEVDNSGIDIEVKSGSKARAVFSGRVSA